MGVVLLSCWGVVLLLGGSESASVDGGGVEPVRRAVHGEPVAPPEIAARLAPSAVPPVADSDRPVAPASTDDEAGTLVKVRVVDAEGSPVLGCDVRATGDESGRSVEATSDERGRLVLRLVPDRYRFDALVASPIIAYGQVSSFVVERDELEVEIAVRRLGMVRGVVLAATTGLPVEGVRVENVVTRSGADRLPATLTDALGRFEFPCHVIGTAASLRFEGDGFGLVSLTLLLDDDRGWAVLGSDVAALDWDRGDVFLTVEMPRERRVTGRCVDASGRPLAGVQVSVSGWHVESFAIRTPDQGRGVTDADGRFEVHGLRDDIDHTIVVDDRAHGHAWCVVPRGPSGDAGRLVVRRGASVGGRVVDVDGRSVIGALVTARVSAADSDRDAPRPTFERSTSTDTAGRFELADVPIGSVDVRVALGRWTGHETRGVACSMRGPFDLGRLTIDSALRRVVGRVVDDEGGPLGDTAVELIDSHGERHAAGRTDRVGFFRLSCRVGERRNDFSLVALDDAGGALGVWDVRAGAAEELLGVSSPR